MKKALYPLKAIRAKCLDCCCGSSNEVRLCPTVECSLYPYRFGKRADKKEFEVVKTLNPQPSTISYLPHNRILDVHTARFRG